MCACALVRRDFDHNLCELNQLGMVVCQAWECYYLYHAW